MGICRKETFGNFKSQLIERSKILNGHAAHRYSKIYEINAEEQKEK
jgi:hypothetical protein